MRIPGTTLALCALLGAVGTAQQARSAPQERSPEATRIAAAATGQDPAARQRQAASRPGGISCVPYARMASGIQVTGNGGHWWANAAGSYARGQEPEPGSVMAFRSTPWMPRGHVAVVRQVVGPRHLRIDHANWGGPGIRRGTVMRNVNVIDVSEKNDWTAVRVQTGWDSNTFGRVYPTFGFIYNRSETETAYASTTARRGPRYEEVAEIPAGGTGR